MTKENFPFGVCGNFILIATKVILCEVIFMNNKVLISGIKRRRSYVFVILFTLGENKKIFILFEVMPISIM